MPFQSKAQQRKCFAANDPNWDCREWAHATPSIKKLPDHKKPARKEATHMATKQAGVLTQAFLSLAQAAIEKKAAERRKLSAMTLMNHFLDKVAAALPMEKQASVRVLQAQLALGKPLSHAIKVAYPKLTGEGRGIVAQKLVKAASDDFAKFVKKKQHGPETATGKPGSPEVGRMMKAAGIDAGAVLERVLGAGRNMFKGQGAIRRGVNTAARGEARGRAAAEARKAVGTTGEFNAASIPGAADDIYRQGLKARQAATRQQVGDRNMARAGVGGAAGGLGLGALLAGRGGQPQPQQPAGPPQAQMKPPTARS